MPFNNNTKTDIQIRRFTFRIVIVFLLAITVATGTITLILTRKSSQEMKSKVVNLIQANTQLQISNLNQYLGRIEDTAALLFSDDIYCEYDATKEAQDAFEKIQQETAIEKRLQDINILQNFSDFGIVYADDSSLGSISNTTLELFPDGGLYAYLEGHITDERKESGWFFDYERCYDRLYYVKRLNEHAIIVAAFYSRELSQSFTDMEDVPGMQSYLVDSAHSIVYAESGEILGRNAEEVWNDLPDGYSNYWIIGDKEVVVVGTCKNDWQVICVAPENVLFAEQLGITRFAIIVYIIMLVVAMTAAGILYSQVAVKDGVLSQIRQKADYDQLTNVLNKQSFRDLVDTKLAHAGEGTKHICMMLDMDNFKLVNDTYGHQEGDKFLKKSVVIFRETLGTQAIIGRMGGDEFAVYIPFEHEEETVMEFVMMSPEVVLVVTPEPTSITDSYSLLKVLRRKNSFNPLYKTIHVVANRVENEAEGAEIFHKIDTVSSKFLNTKLSFLGAVLQDKNASMAVIEQKPLVQAYPGTTATKGICQLVNRLSDDTVEESKKKEGIARVFIDFFRSKKRIR